MNIFVSYASDCLTDYLPHGEGLLSYSWLETLADRGHKIFAYSPQGDVKNLHPNIELFKSKKHFFLPSFSYVYHAYKAQKILRSLHEKNAIDIVWRMYPYHFCSPGFNTMGIKYVIGPLYSSFDLASLNYIPMLKIRPSSWAKHYGGRSWKKFLSNASGLLTDDLKLQNALAERYGNAHIMQLPAIVESPFSCELRNEPEWEHGLTIAFVGHFHPSKRLLDFCRIVSLLIKEGIKVKGIVVGTGEDFVPASKYVQDNSLEENIEFRGALPNSEVFKVLHRSHFLINLREETYGRNMVEAMSVGTPNICVNKLAAREFVGKDNGWLMDNVSPEAYVEQIVYIINNRGRWKQASDSCFHNSKNFSREVVGERLEAFFNTILKSK